MVNHALRNGSLVLRGQLVARFRLKQQHFENGLFVRKNTNRREKGFDISLSKISRFLVQTAHSVLLCPLRDVVYGKGVEFQHFGNSGIIDKFPGPALQFLRCGRVTGQAGLVKPDAQQSLSVLGIF